MRTAAPLEDIHVRNDVRDHVDSDRAEFADSGKRCEPRLDGDRHLDCTTSQSRLWTHARRGLGPGSSGAQSTVDGLVGNAASDDLNLLRWEVRRIIRSEVVAISEETRR